MAGDQNEVQAVKGSVDVQKQCEIESNSGFSGLSGALWDSMKAVVLDRTGQMNSDYSERLDAIRRYRVGDCMREKDKK